MVEEFDFENLRRVAELAGNVEVGRARGRVAAYTKFKTFVYEARLLRPWCYVISHQKTFVYEAGASGRQPLQTAALRAEISIRVDDLLHLIVARFVIAKLRA